MAGFRGAGVLFGGNDGARESDTWLVGAAGWSQVTVLGPAQRQNHAMVTFP